MDEDIKELLEEVNGLKALLDDPHPGLYTWNEFVAKRIRAISQFGNEP